MQASPAKPRQPRISSHTPGCRRLACCAGLRRWTARVCAWRRACGQARLEQGQREEAAADARAALAEARRLQHGEGDSARVQTASALLARAEGLPARKP